MLHDQQERDPGLAYLRCSSHVHRKDLSSASFGPMKTAARLACVFGLGTGTNGHMELVRTEFAASGAVN